jgi:hypothetical protein
MKWRECQRHFNVFKPLVGNNLFITPVPLASVMWLRNNYTVSQCHTQAFRWMLTALTHAHKSNPNDSLGVLSDLRTRLVHYTLCNISSGVFFLDLTASRVSRLSAQICTILGWCLDIKNDRKELLILHCWPQCVVRLCNLVYVAGLGALYGREFI